MTASSSPPPMPSAAPRTRLFEKSVRGSVAPTFPASTTPATVSTSTVAVASLNADSAITVCETFGRS